MGFVTPRFTKITSSKRRRIKGGHTVIELMLIAHTVVIEEGGMGLKLNRGCSG